MLEPGTPKENFFLLYARLVETCLKPAQLTYEEPGILHLTKENGATYVLYLENLWIRCSDDRPAGKETIERYLSVVEHLGEKETPSRESIIPWVKDQEYVDLYLKHSDVAHRHFAADLWIVFATQGEASSRSVSNRDIADLDIKEDQLLPLAITNLKRILPPIETENFGLWSLMWAGADYVPSLLLFDDLWDQIANGMKGDLIAAAPVSDSIFFTSTASPDAIAHIRKRALALEAEGDHVVSSTLLRRIAGGWKAFD
jgi:hypothetical protein